MAQNITLMGASYAAVPAVALPKTGGGTVMFSDASVTTAVESDVGVGKIFLLADGSIGTGTSQTGSTPSATQHTILFEFTDETTQSVTGYWDSSFISDAIRATTPETYNNKTVESAKLDGTAWYTRPTVIWETLFEESNVNFYPDETPPPYCWITDLGDIWPAVGSVWRITFDGVPYVCTAYSYITPWNNNREAIMIGNSSLYDSAAEDTGEPFILYNIGYGAWSGGYEGQNVQSSHALKVEQLVTT